MRTSIRRLGAVLQGIVLGLLLAYAVVSLATIAEGVRMFRYQGF